MDNGWVKYLVDGSKIIGTDREVQLGHASWSKSQNTGLASVELTWKDKTVCIQGVGDYWQSDDMVSSMNSPLILVRRRIEKQIEQNDVVMGVRMDENLVRVVFSHSVNMLDPGLTQIVPIQAADVGKWFTLEITEDPKLWFRLYTLKSRR